MDAASVSARETPLQLNPHTLFENSGAVTLTAASGGRRVPVTYAPRGPTQRGGSSGSPATAR